MHEQAQIDPIAELHTSYQHLVEAAGVGLGLGLHEIAEKAGLKVELLRGSPNALNDDQIKALAKALKLNARKLVELLRGRWTPEGPHINGLQRISSPFRSYQVNAWLAWDPFASQTILVDTGTQPDIILAAMEGLELKLAAILLTHTHEDHCACAEALRKAHPDATIYAPEREPLEGALPTEDGQHFRLGTIAIEPLYIGGHTEGSTAYFISGLTYPVVMVGDLLSAGAIGHFDQKHYQQGLERIRKRILSLPDQTVICPGHGPTTTVAEEKQHNPFF